MDYILYISVGIFAILTVAIAFQKIIIAGLVDAS